MRERHDGKYLGWVGTPADLRRLCEAVNSAALAARKRDRGEPPAKLRIEMRGGRVVFEGTADNILDDPQFEPRLVRSLRVAATEWATQDRLEVRIKRGALVELHVEGPTDWSVQTFATLDRELSNRVAWWQRSRSWICSIAIGLPLAALYILYVLGDDPNALQMFGGYGSLVSFPFLIGLGIRWTVPAVEVVESESESRGRRILAFLGSLLILSILGGIVAGLFVEWVV
jgi:hypothetical protein